MIAARQIFLGRGGAKGWVNPYVTDGLVAMWDGEWNAGGGMHDPAATVWKDLAGDFDLTISPASHFNVDRFQTGTSTYAPTSAYSTTKPDGVMTLEVVGSATQKGLYVFVGSSKITMSIGSGSVGCGWYNKGGGVYEYAAGSTVSLACIYAVTQGGDLESLYANGSPLTLGAYGLTNSSSGISIGSGIGAISTTNIYNQMVGEICSIRAYGRKLSTDEISANYAVDKARFNLP